MTTIAYRGGVMAADSRAYAGDKHPIGSKTKLKRLPDGSLFGVSSSKVGTPEALYRAVATVGVHHDLGQEYDADALVVKRNGSVWYYSSGLGFTGPLAGEYFAIGSGRTAALAAMIMHADAVRAVEIAIEIDVWSGPPVTSLRLGDDQPPNAG